MSLDKINSSQLEKINVTPLEWVEALESGIYEQGHRELRSDKNEFCCLGVLCELEGWQHAMFRGFMGGSLNVNNDLPERLRPDWMSSFEMNRFIRMNDGDRASFAEIAAYARELYNLPTQPEKELER